MGKIVAIGGGEIKKNETLLIDKYIISLSNKSNPRVLFIPTASNDAQGYIDFINEYFTNLDCVVDSLCLISEKLSKREIEDKILNTDIIYVGGGDTHKLMSVWLENDIDIYLKSAYEKGIVLSGLSAGSICWFNFGCNSNDDTSSGLNFLKFAHCPHYNKTMQESFTKKIIKHNIIGIALEDCTALVEIDSKFSIIKSDNNKSAFIIKGNGDNIINQELSVGSFNI